jgi:hypothetical protein
MTLFILYYCIQEFTNARIVKNDLAKQRLAIYIMVRRFLK